MVDGAAADEWSVIAPEWRRLWGSFADPARRALMAACGIGPGTRVLDVGCGSGEFLVLLRDAGAAAVGVDPAPTMVALAGPEARRGDAEHLPFDDHAFDVVVAVNALQFADDTASALREMARVVRPGGRLGIANWAEDARQDLTALELAVAAAHEEELRSEGRLRAEGGLEQALTAAGLRPVASGEVVAPWTPASDADLVDGVLLGEDPDVAGDLAATVLNAARPFRQVDGTYLLHNVFRWAVAEV